VYAVYDNTGFVTLSQGQRKEVADFLMKQNVCCPFSDAFLVQCV